METVWVQHSDTKYFLKNYNMKQLIRNKYNMDTTRVRNPK